MSFHHAGACVPLLSARPSIAISLFAVILLGALTTSASAILRITDDAGGNIGVYWSRFMAIRNAGDHVVIDGTCSSACTMVLGIVPYDHICVTQKAVLGFHAAYQSFLGFQAINDPATRTLMNIYPDPIRHWIARKGGLGSRTVFLSAPELFAYYRKCR